MCMNAKWRSGGCPGGPGGPGVREVVREVQEVRYGNGGPGISRDYEFVNIDDLYSLGSLRTKHLVPLTFPGWASVGCREGIFSPYL